MTAQEYLGNIIQEIVNPGILFLFGLAVIYFIWGVVVFIRKAESPDDRITGGKHIFFATLGMFIMLSAYGIINLILGTLDK